MKKIIASFALIALLATSVQVFAGGVSNFSITMTRQAIDATGDQTIAFTTNGEMALGETFTLTYPTGFDISGATFPAPANFGAGVIAGQVVTFTSTAIIPTATAISVAATTIVNPTDSSETAAGGSSCPTPGANNDEATCYQVVLAGTGGNTGQVVLPILEDDQVMITATVEPELVFRLHSDADDIGAGNDFFTDDANTVDLGVLTSANVKYATGGAASGGNSSAPTGGAHGIQIGTNATAGYAVTVSGATLTNGSGGTIDAIGATVAASAPGTEQFGICLTEDTTGTAGVSASAASQTGVVEANFQCGSGFAFDASAANTIATGNVAGPTNTTFYDVDYAANIDALTASGNYMTTLTYIATGTF